MKLAPEAGFFELEANSIGSDAPETRPRVWYSFSPADANPETRPLALLFQGGPAAAMATLWGGNTGPYTLDPSRTSGKELAPNPYSWTRFTNVLYVDSPFAGFSYMVRPPTSGSPSSSAANEAAAFVRVLLRFLAHHPQLERNPIFLVGESYGGARATLMLQQLLHYPLLRDPSAWYPDAPLAEAIEAHLRRARNEPDRESFTPEEVASQFRGQVLIQGAVLQASPGIPTPEQRELGVALNEDASARVDSMVSSLLKPQVLSSIAGVDVESIRWLHASERTNGETCQSTYEDDEAKVDNSRLAATFGALSTRDAYYVSFCDLKEFHGVYAERIDHQFIDNLRYISTFMTLAPLDNIVRPELIIQQLPSVPGVTHLERQALTPRVQQLAITLEPGGTRTIRLPVYAESGHSVAMFQPELLAEDVRSWLDEVLE